MRGAEGVGLAPTATCVAVGCGTPRGPLPGTGVGWPFLTPAQPASSPVRPAASEIHWSRLNLPMAHSGLSCRTEYYKKELPRDRACQRQQREVERAAPGKRQQPRRAEAGQV